MKPGDDESHKNATGIYLRFLLILVNATTITSHLYFINS